MQRRNRHAPLTILCPESAYPRVRFFIRLFNRCRVPAFVRFNVFVPGNPCQIGRFANSETQVWGASECHVVDAAAYAFLQGRTKVVIATDTRANCPSVIALAKRATALFHDTTFPTRAARMARVRGHSSPEGAGIDATHASAQTLVLTHVSDIRFPDERVLVLGARHHYKGRIIVAKDMETYEF
jgi:ribonuclease BN (tRNA processing enzyme)